MCITGMIPGSSPGGLRSQVDALEGGALGGRGRVVGVSELSEPAA